MEGVVGREGSAPRQTGVTVRASLLPVVTVAHPPGSSRPLQVHSHVPAWHWACSVPLCREKWPRTPRSWQGGLGLPGAALEVASCSLGGTANSGAEHGVGRIAPRCLPSIRAPGREVPSNTHSTAMSTHLGFPEEDLSLLAMGAGSLSQICRRSPGPPLWHLEPEPGYWGLLALGHA